MKYYDTYEEAKAAFPDCDAVVTTGKDWCHSREKKEKFVPVYKAKPYSEHQWTYCEERDMSYPVFDDNAWIIATPPKHPKTRTEYVKVEFERASKAVEYFEGYALDKSGDEALCHFTNYEYIELNHVKQVALFWSQGNLYRKMETEIDWREEVSQFITEKMTSHWSTPFTAVIDEEPEFILEMCRVALRANGELG